jgi:hypothetical protein
MLFMVPDCAYIPNDLLINKIQSMSNIAHNIICPSHDIAEKLS